MIGNDASEMQKGSGAVNNLAEADLNKRSVELEMDQRSHQRLVVGIDRVGVSLADPLKEGYRMRRGMVKFGQIQDWWKVSVNVVDS